MKRKNYRILPGILAAVLALSLCGCGADQTASTSANNQKAAETAEAATDAKATEADTEANAAESSEEEEITFTSGEGYEESDTDYFQTYATSVESFTEEDKPLYVLSGESSQNMQVYFLNGIEDIPYISMDDLNLLLNVFLMDESQAEEDAEIVDDTETVAGMEIVAATETVVATEIVAGTETVAATDTVVSTEEASQDESSDTLSVAMEPLDENGAKGFAFVRDNGAVMSVEFNNNTITFSDWDTFTAPSGAVNGLDKITISTNGGNQILTHTGTYYRKPEVMTIDLDYYGVYPVYKDGMGYLPFQTVNDLLFNRIGTGVQLFYNGEAVVIADIMKDNFGVEHDGDKTTGDIYYSVESKNLSNEAAIFKYNEMCLLLDYSYGLQDEHEITSFNNLFLQTGLYENMSSENPDDGFKGLMDLIGVLADWHTTIEAKSCYSTMEAYCLASAIYSQSDIDVSDFNSNSSPEYYDALSLYKNARTAVFPDMSDYMGYGYKEVGNTAYICFDSFIYDATRNYYEIEPTNTNEDIFELIIYANEQIHREGSPIENVVLDLSNNIGGDIDAGAAVISWMLGQARFQIEDTITGAQGTCTYRFDANLNGINTEEDTEDNVSDYNLYCLISPVSFSCGNLVPSALKQSGKVTILGKTSTGGACIVMNATAADGSSFYMSSPFRLSTLKNGVYSSVDEGVEPDLPITHTEHFYDLEYLTEYINSLP